MSGPAKVTRRQVLAYRSLMHGLSGGAPDDALLDLGVQDTPVGSAAQALSARGLSGSGLTTVWSFRGAPHRHRTKDLPSLAKALWPLSDDDAYARLAGFGTTLKKNGLSGVDAVATTAAAVAAVVTKPTSKGDLSAAVTKRIPDDYAFWCRGCGATHVHDQLLRLSALPGGARIVEQSPLTFDPILRWSVPTEAIGTQRLLLAYLTLHGPATDSDTAGYLGTAGTRVRGVWPQGLAEVRVGSRAAWLPESCRAALGAADVEPFVRLLPPSDPYLQARDRDLLVPDAAHRQALWTVLAGPGALVVDGDVKGTWRAKQARKGRLAVTVTPWASLPAKRRTDVEGEAARVAEVRGVKDVEVAFAE
jgi:hypothetical protein